MQYNSPGELTNAAQSMLDSRFQREERFRELREFILLNLQTADWVRDFMWLMFMPKFLNVAVVDGECNCNCRMCSAGRGRPFRHLSLEQMRTILRHAPTATGISFSAGNSEPLLNPELPGIIQACAQRGCGVDFYTNGLALTPEMAQTIVASGSVNMINFSLDAATEQTYRRIRRRSFAKARSAIENLVKLKKETDKNLPNISISLVEMADNITELPDLVDYASTIGAFRVFVEALLNPGGENLSATTNPAWKEAVAEAEKRAARHGLMLHLPAKLKLSQSSDSQKTPNLSNCDPKKHADDNPFTHTYCAWMQGAWIAIDGAIAPCCITGNVPMGNIFDGPLQDNKLFQVQKMKLFTGKVFPSCLKNVENCLFLSERQNKLNLRSLVIKP